MGHHSDLEARNDFALSFSGYVVSVARRYALAYGSFSPRIEFLDLAQMAHLAILERMDRALEHPNPIGFLHKTIAGVILDFCRTRASLITSPRDHDGPQPLMQFDSLDTPGFGDDEDGYALNEVTCTELHFPGPERDYSSLYQAIDELAEDYQDIVVHLFGINCAPEPLADIMRRQCSVKGKPYTKLNSSPKRRAIQRLQKILEPVYATA